jgi:hypothetical protein
MAAGDRHYPHRILDTPWNDDADRDLAVVRSVRGIKGAAAGIKTHFAVDRRPQFALEPRGVDRGRRN